MSITRLDEIIQIGEILEEASAVGLQREVSEYANRLIDESPEITPLEAYVMAFNKWIN
jgi:DNA polymerase III delta prime subunit